MLAHDAPLEAQGAQMGEGLGGLVEFIAGALGGGLVVAEEVEVVFRDGDAEAALELGRVGGDLGEGGTDGAELLLADLVALIFAHTLPVEFYLEVVEDLFASYLEIFDVFLGDLAVPGRLQQLLVERVNVFMELPGYASQNQWRRRCEAVLVS